MGRFEKGQFNNTAMETHSHMTWQDMCEQREQLSCFEVIQDLTKKSDIPQMLYHQASSPPIFGVHTRNNTQHAKHAI